MATIEKIEKELNDAKKEHEEAKEKLKKWEEGKYGGVKLNELEDELMKGNLNEEQRTKLERRMDRLYEEKKRLEKKVDDKWNQVEEWGKAFRDFGKGEGNEQIT